VIFHHTNVTLDRTNKVQHKIIGEGLHICAPAQLCPVENVQSADLIHSFT